MNIRLNKNISLVEQYFSIQLEYSKKYGFNTIVIMEVGSFMECYGIQNDTETIGNLPEVADLLNIQLTRKNKMILENNHSNPLMIGFPSAVLQKYCDILIENDYTIIVIEQITSPPNPDRAITKILSPSTYLNSNRQRDSNALMSIWVEQQKSLFHVGKTVIDVSTGNVQISEALYKDSEIELLKQQIIHWIEQDLPTEILWISEPQHYDILNTNIVQHTHIPNIQMEKITYQNQFLKKWYDSNGFLTPIEYLGLERHPHVVSSLVYGLQFAFEHQSTILEKIRKPTWISNNEYVEIYNEGLRQLQVFRDKRGSQIGRNGNGRLTRLSCVYDVINNTHTTMGNRQLRHRISHPIWNHDVLEKRWNGVEEWTKRDRQSVIQLLKTIRDVERLWRKVELRTLNNYELTHWIESIDIIIELYRLIQTSDNEYINRHREFFQHHLIQKSKIDLKRLNQCSNTRWVPYFNSNFFDGESVDTFIQQWNANCKEESESIEQLETWIQTWERRLNDVIVKKSKKAIPTDEMDDGVLIRRDYIYERNASIPDGICFTLTAKRASLLSGILKEAGIEDVEMEKHNTSMYKIVSPFINKYATQWIKSYQWLYRQHEKLYTMWLSSWDTYTRDIQEIINEIIDIDISVSMADIAVKYNYVRPKILEHSENGSGLKLVNVRHPLVERFETGATYIPHSVEFGSDHTYQGYILTGLNSSGKTVLMKSIGLAVLLAQSGLYVPCDSMEFVPYRKLFTRISGEDNLLASRSSFAVEMIELKSILEHANEYSLILGDELCRGTEQESALSIVATTLKWWLNRKISFVTATHLYPLFQLEGFCPDEWIGNRLYVGHLWVEIDKEKKRLKYHRLLKQGLGESLYGLEVAGHLIQNTDWTYQANQYRLAILKQSEILLETHQSRYHPYLFMDECLVCHTKERLHSHHLDHQCSFEKEERLIRDDLRNLVILCEEHHRDVHNGKIHLELYQGMKDNRIEVIHNSSI